MASNYSFCRPGPPLSSSSSSSSSSPSTSTRTFTTLISDTPSITKENHLFPTSGLLMHDSPIYPPQNPSFTYSFGSDPVSQPHSTNWHMFPGQNQSSIPTGLLRNSRGHQRTTSESTVNSTGPSSPFMQTAAFPYIANPDQSPTASFFNDNDQSFGNVGYVPSKLSHTSAAHLAMQNLGIDHHSLNMNDDMPDFSHSSRHSVSSRGRDSPSTPQPRTSDEHEERPALFKVPTSGEEMSDYGLLERYLYVNRLAEYKQNGPRVELNRTESAAFADELFNPHNNYDSTSTSASSLSAPANNTSLLSPHRNLVDERLRAANSIRSRSPTHGSMSRDRSPFRHGSPLAPTIADSFKSPVPFLATAADSRRQQREEASAREWASHVPSLRRETTKTMSPKDALLEFTDPDQGSDVPLFADAGYADFGAMPAPRTTNLGAFRASEQPDQTSSTFNFLPPQQPAAIPANPYAPPQYRPTTFGETTPPDFPAHLASMESSMSEGPGPSSQGSMASVPMPRPANTPADTGTYTCSASGCTQRFDTPAKLLRHKRETHSARDSLSTAPSTSPERSDSPEHEHDPDHLGSGMTSAALAERNSQQGPHKCSRINPSTGKPCNTIFSRPYDLTRHEDTIHNRQKVKVRCQYCREEKSFSRNDALTRHMRVVHPEVDFQGKRGRRGDQF